MIDWLNCIIVAWTFPSVKWIAGFSGVYFKAKSKAATASCELWDRWKILANESKP